MAVARKGRLTCVDGVVVRSMLEGAWLKFFNLIGVGATYEPERFPDNVSRLGYLPDFYLDSGIYIEVKPTYQLFRAESEKCKGFVRATGKDLLVVIGKPPGIELYVLHRDAERKVSSSTMTGAFCWSADANEHVKHREITAANRAIAYVKDDISSGTWVARAVSDNWRL